MRFRILALRCRGGLSLPGVDDRADGAAAAGHGGAERCGAGRPGRRGGRGAPPGLEPRIVSFEAQPGAVRPDSRSCWSGARKTRRASPSNRVIGSVTPRGSRQVTPSATTTYTLTMTGGPSRSIVVTVEGTTPAVAGAVDPPAAPVRRGPHARREARSRGVYNFAGLPAGATPPPSNPGRRNSGSCVTADDVRGKNDADDRQRLQAARHPADLYHAVSVSDRADAEARS